MNKRNGVRAGGVFILAVATLSAYWPALWGDYIWTDAANVTNWHHADAWQEVTAIWTSCEREQYFPLTFTSFWLEHLFWGSRPQFSHLINILLHIANALLLIRVLERMGIRGAWFAGAIFALHPVHVESVAWIVERKNVLSTFFYLLSLRGYLCFDLETKRRHYLWSIAFFGLALLSKTTTVVLPVVIALCLVHLHRSITRHDIVRLIPFLMLSLGMAIVSILYEHAKNPHIAEELHAPLAERVAIAGGVFWFYVGKMLAPTGLSLVYEKWVVDPDLLVTYVPALGVLILFGGFWWMRRRWGNGPLLGAIYYLAALLPLLGFFPFYYMRISYVADHFQYLPSLGLIALLSAGVWHCASRYGGRHSGNLTKTGALTILTLLWLFSWRQSHLYKDNYTIWKDALRKSPEAWVVHGMFARAAAKKGEIDSALFQYGEEIRLRPQGARAYNDLGVLQIKLGRYPAAGATFQAAIIADSKHPAAYRNLGNLYAENKQYEQAIEMYKKSIQCREGQFRVHYKLAKILERLGRMKEAKIHYQRTSQLSPNFRQQR